MRRHFVFLRRCGCPVGVVDYGRHRTTEDQAWRAMYASFAEQRAAARSVRCVLVDHDTYSREYYPLMTTPCPHTDERVKP